MRRGQKGLFFDVPPAKKALNPRVSLEPNQALSILGLEKKCFFIADFYWHFFLPWWALMQPHTITHITHEIRTDSRASTVNFLWFSCNFQLSCYLLECQSARNQWLDPNEQTTRNESLSRFEIESIQVGFSHSSWSLLNQNLASWHCSGFIMKHVQMWSRQTK